MPSTLEILLAAAGWFGAYAALAAATGHLLGRCREESSDSDIALACIFSFLGVFYALGKYTCDCAARSREIAEIERARVQEIAAAEHKVRLAALGKQAEEVARI